MPKGYPKTEEARRRQMENLKKFSFKKGNALNPNGRPRKPKSLTDFISEMEDCGFETPTKDTIVRSYLFMVVLPEDKLKELLNDKTRPMFIRIVARGILDKKGFDIIERIVDRIYGCKKFDITSGGAPLYPEPIRVEIIDRASQIRNTDEDNTDNTRIQRD